MISESTLRFLIGQKKTDAKILFRNQRFATSIYIMGYAIEIALKRKICKTLDFIDGLPEDQIELKNYATFLSMKMSSAAFSQSGLTHIKQIRNHDLNRLLHYSGMRGKIYTQFTSQWICVNNWNPQYRYLRQCPRKKSAEEFIAAGNKLIKALS